MKKIIIFAAIMLFGTTEIVLAQSNESDYSLSGIARTLKNYKISYLESFHNGLAKVCVERKDLGLDYNDVIGLINKKGEVVLPFEYRKIGEFSENGLIAVSDINYKWGYADKKGNVVIPCQYKDAGKFSDGLANVSLEDGNICYINEQGEVVVPPFIAYRAGEFHDGIAPIEFEKKKTSFINKKGEVVVPPSEGRCRNYTEGLFFVVGHDGGWLMNSQGKIITPKQGWALKGVFSDGLMGFRKIGERKMGFIDVTGRIVIPAQFDDVKSFNEGLAAIQLNDKWGFINTEGEIVIPVQFDKIGISYFDKKFSNGLAAVYKDGKWGFINKEGEIVIPCKYDKVSNFYDGLCVVWDDNRIGLIDKYGFPLTQFGYFQHISDFSEGLSAVELNGEKGYMDKDGISSLEVK